jgi:hypothetical protein
VATESISGDADVHRSGDFDPKLLERVLILKRIQKETVPKVDKMLLRELTEVIAKLKLLQ